MRPRKKSIAVGIASIVLLANLVGIFTFKQLYTPKFGSVLYEHQETGKTGEMDFPFGLEDKLDGTFFLQFTIDIPRTPIYPTRYRFIPDDCIRSIAVNGRAVPMPAREYCDLRGHNFDLGDAIEPGLNVVSVTLHDHGGFAGLNASIAPSDFGLLAMQILMVVLVCVYAAYLFFLSDARKEAYCIAVSTFIFGLVLLVYSNNVAFNERSNDAGYHMEYIQYVVRNSAVPKARDGFMFYQPPLYYFLVAGVIQFAGIFGNGMQIALQDIKILSWLLMVCSMLIAGIISLIVLPKKSESIDHVFFVGIAGIMPAVAFMTSRIHNDVLVHFLTVTSLALLFAWWRKPNNTKWILAFAIACLALLTKSNALLLVGVLGICLFLRRGVLWSDKGRMLVIVGVLLVLLFGWYAYRRLIIEKEGILVNNSGAIMKELTMPNTFSSLCTFNPIKVIQTTFNHPWEDRYRRKYYWEFLYKSAFVGEFSWRNELKPLAAQAEVLGFFIAFFTFGGIVLSVRTYKPNTVALPFAIVLLIYVAGSVYLRVTTPFVSTQDFRYITPLVLPVGYFSIAFVQSLGKWKTLSRCCIGAFIISCSSFVIASAYWT